MEKRKYINIPYTKRILFFGLVGFILGSTLGVFFLPQFKEQFIYIQKRLYTSLTPVKKNDLSYFLFGIYDCVKQMILIMFITFTIFFEIYGKILFAWKGFVMGVIFSAAVKCYGVMGVLLFGANWFPQGILYAVALIIQLSLCYQIREENSAGQIKWKGNIGTWGVVFLVCFVCVAVGGYLECNVNLDLLKHALENCINQGNQG